MTPPFKLGQLLHDRYLIQLDLDQGRLSRNYLANDTHRFDEPCLVKVFAPDLEPSLTAEKALNLFQQQARTLYSLDHPQIANFREFFQLPSPDRPQFYLVQDFIEGQTYQDLLHLRRSKGQVFTEGEIKQLFRLLLPVLSYLHERGIFHRQLTPANIVWREIDGLPMLVEFSEAPTDDLTESADFPEIRLAASPENDLFCLGLCGLRLLSEQKPTLPTLTNQSSQYWQAQLDPLLLSQEFRAFLLKLLMRPPELGFDSAAKVLAVLDKLPSNSVIKAMGPAPKKEKSSDRLLPQPLFADNEAESTESVMPPETLPLESPTPSPTVTKVAKASKPSPKEHFAPVKLVATRATALFSKLPSPKSMLKFKGVNGFFKKMLLLLGLMAIATGIGWGTGKLWLTWRAQVELKAAQDAPPPPKTPLELKNEIRTRRLNLGLSPQSFQALVNDWLGFKLNQIPADPPDPAAPPPGTEEEQLETAIALLTPLETLSPEALNLLSKNPPGDRRRWIPRVNQLRLSSRSFNDLVNARFRHYFPDLNPDDLDTRPLDQLWNALAFDSLVSLEDGSHYQRVSLADESSLSLSGQFDPGSGYAYAINIPQGQSLDLKLEAPATARISFYSPSGREKMLENSANHQWSGPLSETGYYELVITSDSSEPTSFQVQLQVR